MHDWILEYWVCVWHTVCTKKMETFSEKSLNKNCLKISSQVKPFEEIPGPPMYPLIGSRPHYLLILLARFSSWFEYQAEMEMPQIMQMGWFWRVFLFRKYAGSEKPRARDGPEVCTKIQNTIWFKQKELLNGFDSSCNNYWIGLWSRVCGTWTSSTAAWSGSRSIWFFEVAPVT